MNLKKILITDKVHLSLISRLEKEGFIITYDTNYDNFKLAESIDQWYGLIVNSKMQITKSLVEKAKNLSFIGRLGSGLEIIDVEAAILHGIGVINSPEGNRDAVAEHEIGMLLSLLNNIAVANEEVKNFIWNRELRRGTELMGKTIGIIGFGHTGSRLAKKLSTWDLQIQIYDKYVKNVNKEFEYVNEVELDTLLQTSDIISLHVPLTKETEFLLNEETLSKTKKGVIISNTSRGKIVHTESLIKYLKNGHISGAVLDVFENEKQTTLLPDEKLMYETLYSFNNVIVTPHIAGWTHESLYKIANILCDKILTFESKKTN